MKRIDVCEENNMYGNDMGKYIFNKYFNELDSNEEYDIYFSENMVDMAMSVIQAIKGEMNINYGTEFFGNKCIFHASKLIVDKIKISGGRSWE